MTTTLEEKFEAIELQLADQHTAIGNALDSILTALGAPPPTATITLATVSAQLTAINNNLIGIAIANGTFHSALLELLGLINTNTDTMLNNNSLNAQRMIAAILSTICPCATDAPLLPLPIDVTPTSLADEAKCRRIQFYLSVFGNWLNKIANYGSSAGFVTGDTIGTLLGLAAAEAGITATGAEIGAAAGIPGAVIGAIVGLIVGAIFTFGGAILIDYASQFNSPTVKEALLAAMFAENNASAGNTAFNTVILANFPAIPADIINALWWAQWNNDIYSGTPVVDDSAFDGSICVDATASCITIDSTMDNVYDDGVFSVARMAIVWPTPYAAGTAQPSGPFTHSTDVILGGDLAGYRVRHASGYTPRLIVWAGATIIVGETLGVVGEGVYYTLPSGSTSVLIDGYGDDVTAFSIEFCPPA